MNRKAKHGTTYLYSKGCRCDDCRAAKAVEKRRYSKKASGKRGRKPKTFCVPIAVCMSRDFGLTNVEIAKVFCCSSSTVKNKLESAGYKKPSQSQTAEQKLYGAWDRYGYSDKFEIAGKYAKKNEHIEIRCKLCGTTFARFPESVYKQHSNIRCPGCKIHRDDKTDAPRDYNLITYVGHAYSNGLTVRSIAEMYGLQERYVSDMLKASGIEPDCGRYNKATTKYKTKATMLEQGKNAIETDLYNWKNKRRSVIEQSLCDITKQAGKAHKALESISKYEPKIATCKHCGKQWVFWPDHRKKYGRVSNPPAYCSKKCNYKHFKTGTISDRLRKRGRSDERRDLITLDEVIKRDNGICYICGRKTSKEDSWTDANGYHVCGPTYPTRDHVIPIAKGGTHTWDNVRLACRDCNSTKSDRTLEEVSL